jgi:hypothetical protein
LSGRGLCDGLITRPEESYRLWLVVACDQETSKTRRVKPATGLWKIQPQWVVTPGKQTNILLVIKSELILYRALTSVFFVIENHFVLCEVGKNPVYKMYFNFYFHMFNVKVSSW